MSARSDPVRPTTEAGGSGSPRHGAAVPDQAAGPALPARPAAVVTLALVAAGVLALDIVTKHIVVARLTDHPPVRLLGGAVYLVLVRNPGAAFSLGTRYTFVFPLVTVVVVGWICWMARRLRSLPWAVALGLLLAGALGNFVDRVFRAPGFLVGHVIDFVSLFSSDGHVWPIFNVADSMGLVSGVTLAVFLELTGRRRDGTRPGRTGGRAEW